MPLFLSVKFVLYMFFAVFHYVQFCTYAQIGFSG